MIISIESLASPKYYVSKPSDMQIISESYQYSPEAQKKRIGASYILPRFQPNLRSIHNETINNRRAFDCGVNTSNVYMFNYTGRDLRVTTSNNTPIFLKPSPTPMNDEKYLIVRREYYFTSTEERNKTVAYLRRNIDNKCMESKTMLDAIEQTSRGGYGTAVIVEHKVHVDEIDAARGHLYHKETDLMIALENHVVAPAHPRSSNCVDPIARTLDGVTRHENELFFVARYFTEDRNAKPLYARFMNKVFVLKPIVDNKPVIIQSMDRTGKLIESESSRYIELYYVGKHDATDPGEYNYRLEIIELEDAKKKFEIYESFEEANSPISQMEKLEAKHKDRLEHMDLDHRTAQREHRQKIIDLEATQRSKDHAHEQEKRKLQDKIDALKQNNEAEAERIKAQADKLKAEREAQLHSKKVASDNLKIATTIVMSVLTIVPIFLKSRAALAKE